MVVLTGSGPNTAIVHIKYEKLHWELKETDNQWQHNKHAQKQYDSPGGNSVQNSLKKKSPRSATITSHGQTLTPIVREKRQNLKQAR